MLINFSIQNFGSIKEMQTLSFEAEKSQHLEDCYVIHTNGLRLLKLALIYGANASGKTTILKALQFLRDLVLEPQEQKTQWLHFTPFLFDPDTPKQNTLFEIDFVQSGIRYFYEVELNQKSIVREDLFFVKMPNKKNKVNLFKRTTDPQKQLTNIRFNPAITIDDVYLKTLTANTLWNNTVLAGFLKTNIELKELTDATNWFKEYLNRILYPVYSHDSLEIYITKCIDRGIIDQTSMVKILKKADFNISNFYIRKGSSTETRIEFEHTVKDKPYLLVFHWQSNGTQRYFGLAGLLCLLINNSTLFPIDELESSLHPDLFQHFLLSFLVNSQKSQLIATTHNREILNNRDIFRNDAIWITDKDNENCATELYSLSAFDTKVIRDTTNILNAYKLGKLGGMPNLGSYYINTHDKTE